MRVCVSVCMCVCVYLDVSVLLTLETKKFCFDVFPRFSDIYVNCNKPQRSVWPGPLLLAKVVGRCFLVH